MASCTACTHSAAPGLLTDLQGEAAKKTVQLAFEKIRGLQQDLDEKCKVGRSDGRNKLPHILSASLRMQQYCNNK